MDRVLSLKEYAMIQCYSGILLKGRDIPHDLWDELFALEQRLDVRADLFAKVRSLMEEICIYFIVDDRWKIEQCTKGFKITDSTNLSSREVSQDAGKKMILFAKTLSIEGKIDLQYTTQQHILDFAFDEDHDDLLDIIYYEHFDLFCDSP